MANQKRIFKGRNRSYGPAGSGFYGMAREHKSGGGGAGALGIVANVFCAILIALLILSFAVTFTLNSRTLYTNDLNALNIPAQSGYSEQDIYANYDALISYNSVFYRGELTFPTLKMSESGRTHFKEVKNIFDALQIALFIAGIGSVVLLFLRRKQAASILLVGGAITLAVPIVTLLLFVLSGWQRFFTGFHKLFFGNDLWIFDPVEDPVIGILPDAYFLHCLIMIIAIVLSLAILIGVMGIIVKKYGKHPTGMWESQYTAEDVKM